MSKLIPAVIYLRRSTTAQEASIEDQRKAIQKLSGYRILREYVDDGISGDSTEKRVDFQRMIADAQQKRDFKVILCWDQSRFGRFDGLEGGFWIHPLRQVGVSLVTVCDGAIDWESFAGRVANFVAQEAKHGQLIDLSRNVARGQLQSLLAGSWVGPAPYAYQIEGPKKNKRLGLGDPVKVRVVQRIFAEYVGGRSMGEISRRLNADAIPGPKGRTWRFDSVREILTNPTFTGDHVGGRTSNGKYSEIRGGQVVKREGTTTRKPASEYIIHRDHHPAIVTRDVFEQAQAIQSRGKIGRNRNSGQFIFSGKLVCGRCGAKLHGKHDRGRTFYACASVKRAERLEEKCECAGTIAKESAVLQFVADKIEDLLGSGTLDWLHEGASEGALTEKKLPKELRHALDEVRGLIAPPKPAVDRKRIERELKKLGEKIDKARSNLVLLDPENIPAAQQQISIMAQERARLEIELQQQPPSEQDINGQAQSLTWTLACLASSCRSLANAERDQKDGMEVTGNISSPQALRELLAKVEGISLTTTVTGEGSRRRHHLESGEMKLFREQGTTRESRKTSTGVSSLSCGGCPAAWA